MTASRSIILIITFLFCSFCSQAQDTNYVYQDTALLQADSVKGNAMEMAPAENEEGANADDYTADTILRNNQLTVEPDSIAALQNSKPFAYSKNLDSLLYQYQQSQVKEEATENNDISWLGRFFMSPVTKYFFWILAGLFIFFILYKLFFTEGFFQRPSVKSNVTVLLGEKEDLSITADYGKLIAQALTNGNYRVAVRYHYLQSLQKLSSKGAIQFAADKTNYEYVRELSGKTYKNAFASLTLNYEYVWYGEFEIDENIFNTMQHKFKQFNSGV